MDAACLGPRIRSFTAAFITVMIGWCGWKQAFVVCPFGVVVRVSPFVPRTWRFWLKAKEVSKLGLRRFRVWVKEG